MRAAKILGVFEKKVDDIVGRVFSQHPSRVDYENLMTIVRRQIDPKSVSEKAYSDSKFYFSKILIGYQAATLLSEEKKFIAIADASKEVFDSGSKKLEAIYGNQNRLREAWKNILDAYRRSRNATFLAESEPSWEQLELLSFDSSQWHSRCVQSYLEECSDPISIDDFIRFIINRNTSALPQHYPTRLSTDNGFMIARQFESEGRCIATHLPFKNSDDEINARLTQSFLSMIFRENVMHVVELAEPLKKARRLRIENVDGEFKTQCSDPDEMQLIDTKTVETRTIKITSIQTNNANQLNLDNHNIRMLHRAYKDCASNMICVHSAVRNSGAEQIQFLFTLLNRLCIEPAFNKSCQDAIKMDCASDESFNVIFSVLSEEFRDFCGITCFVFSAEQLKAILSQFLLLAGVEMGLCDMSLDHLREKIFSTKPLPHIVVTPPESPAIVSGVFSRRATIVNPNLLSVPAICSRFAMRPE